MKKILEATIALLFVTTVFGQAFEDQTRRRDSGGSQTIGMSRPGPIFARLSVVETIGANWIFDVGHRMSPDTYLNWGLTLGDSGYGFRDSTGTLQFKNSGGSWVAFSSLAVTPVSIANGGTGATTALGAFNNLSPLTTLGDVLYRGATNNLRLAGNTTATRQFLRQTGTGSASAAPAWDTVTKTDVGLANVENTALSTWAGSANLTTLGTVTTGTWSAGSVLLSTQIAAQLSPYGAAAGNTGEIRFLELAATGTNYVGFKSANDITTDRIWTLPAADGGPNQVLTTNGSGILSWSTPPGTGAPAGAQYVTLALDATLSAERVLTGTTNQITVTDGGANGNVTLSTPQDLHTGASPSFVRATLTQTTGTAPLTVSSTTVVANLNADQVDGRDETAFALLAGRAGGQTLIGGTAASENLTLQSTANATRGKILFGTSGYDGVNNRLGIATNAPGQALDVRGTAEITNVAATQTIRINPVATPPLIGTTTNHALAFITNSATRMTLNTAGRMDLTGGPFVVTAAQPFMDIVDTDAAGLLRFSGLNEVLAANVDPTNVDASSAFAIRIDGAELFRFTDLSRFGIGTLGPNSKIDLRTSAIGATPDDAHGMSLVNGTAAALDTQQYSPGVLWQGTGWRTNPTAQSQVLKFRVYLRTIQGAAAPSSALDFEAAVGVGAYSQVMSITSAGALSVADATTTRTNLGLAIGTNVQAFDADLSALAALASTGLAVRSATDTWVQRSIVAGSASITVSNGGGVAGNPSIDTAQNIQTSASPTFGGLTVNGSTTINTNTLHVDAAANEVRIRHTTDRFNAGLTTLNCTLDATGSTANESFGAMCAVVSGNIVRLEAGSIGTGSGGSGNPSLGLYVAGSDRLTISTGGIVNIPGSLTLGTPLAVAQGGTASTTPSAARTALGVAIGTDVQGFNTTLNAIAGLATNGLIARTGSGTAATRTITGTASQIAVSNGDGVSGNPTLSLPSSVVMTNLELTTNFTFDAGGANLDSLFAQKAVGTNFINLSVKPVSGTNVTNTFDVDSLGTSNANIRAISTTSGITLRMAATNTSTLIDGSSGDVQLQQAGTNTIILKAGGVLSFPNLTTSTGTTLVIDASNNVFRQSSSIRFKEQIRDLAIDAALLDDLRPVAFRYKATGTRSIGLIAEEVADVLPELVTYDAQGRPESVHYDLLSVLLLKKIRQLEERVHALENH